MPKDGSATRRRLLDAATAEFSRHGIAGARVDRIAESARANKAQIYAWFDSKDGLFDAVFAEHLSLIVDLVPFDARDLPGYVVRLYDAYLQQPSVILLATWARLERVPTGDLLTSIPDDVARKLDAIARRPGRGPRRPRPRPPRRLLHGHLALDELVARRDRGRRRPRRSRGRARASSGRPRPRGPAGLRP